MRIPSPFLNHAHQLTTSVLFFLAFLLILPVQATEKEGQGGDALSKGHKTKNPDDVVGTILDGKTPESLALTALSNWIRYQKPTEDMDFEPIRFLAVDRGFRDQVATILAFNAKINDSVFKTLIDRMAGSQDPELHRLAAATLSTMYVHRLITDPKQYNSPLLDQRLILGNSRKQEQPFPGQNSDMDIAPAFKRYVRVLKSVPMVPTQWLQSGDATLVTLAMVAAAADGRAEYAEAMMRLDGGTGTAAGARLLYLCRQETPPEAEETTRMFTDAFRGPANPIQLVRPGATPEPLDLYRAEIPGGILACMALGQLADPTHIPLLLKALEVGNPEVQMEALRALRRMKANEAVQTAFAKLLPQAPGMLLPDLCAAIATHPDKRLIPLLLLRLKEEDGRFRLDLAWALSALAGEVKGTTPEEWITWWKENRTTFELDPEIVEAFRTSRAPQTIPMPATGRFYSLSMYSTHLCFVVDTSYSMKGSRMESLRTNMVHSFEGFEYYRKARNGRPGDLYYNVVDFGADLIVMEPGKLVQDINPGIKRAETMPMTWATRSFDGIWEASRIEGVDTLYFLTDGDPNWGQMETWSRIHSTLALLYWHRPIAVWSVAFEAGSNAKEMRVLSYGNFGLFENL